MSNLETQRNFMLTHVLALQPFAPFRSTRGSEAPKVTKCKKLCDQNICYFWHSQVDVETTLYRHAHVFGSYSANTLAPLPG